MTVDETRKGSVLGPCTVDESDACFIWCEEGKALVSAIGLHKARWFREAELDLRQWRCQGVSSGDRLERIGVVAARVSRAGGPVYRLGSRCGQ